MIGRSGDMIVPDISKEVGQGTRNQTIGSSESFVSEPAMFCATGEYTKTLFIEVCGVFLLPLPKYFNPPAFLSPRPHFGEVF